jgi:hypothetical protein
MGTIIGVAATGLALALAPQVPPPVDDASERIYGRVLTSDGERLEGFLRWDRNETHWSDLLDGRAFISRDHALEAERLDDELRRRRALERSVSLPGLRITWDEDDTAPLEGTPAAVRFGHVRALEPRDRRAWLTLESGDEVELASSSSDLGRSFRGLVVERAMGGEVELEWEDVARVDFVQAPEGARPASRRLHGTLRTRSGSSWTGLVAWSLDESLTTDELDGEGPDGEMRTIAFGDVASIARESRRSARVRLRSGEEQVLEDTNDVGSDIPGIEITDPSFGRVVVDWDAFASLDFHPATEPGVGKDHYSGGAPLQGTVVAQDGRTVRGRIRWDNDEDRTWDVLDAELHGEAGVRVAVEMALVRSIEPGPRFTRVTLHDGRTSSLSGTEDLGDLGEANRGVFVTTDEGETVLVRWRELRSVTFEP